ncbi:2,3-bisphosphoglycerate-independent phosphoglycerate mutase-like [Rhopilema esculentum]|uniref:2,3-bisphosphoglycerate-independent phosphoglycerate mutase-like n=1 Tax=Rhopilema esculentum TaxID=499914 RepID=UPI0031E1C9AE
MAGQKVCLIVIDGWGMSDVTEGNAIHHGKTPVMNGLCQGDGYTTLDASGLSVGLPAGLMGNSEVGHLNIGAGRVVYQDIVRINMTSENKEFQKNEFFAKACAGAKAGNGRLHFLGLVSDGGVHSHINHLFSMIEAAKVLGVPKCFIQFFSDGRDTRPSSGVEFVQQVIDKLKELQYGSLASVTGRYYAMDRDKRFERNKIAFEGLVQGAGEETTLDNLIKTIEARYANKETDEFLKPIRVDKEGTIKDGDTMVFIDFRADRMRQIVEAFGVQRHFETDVVPKDLKIFCMTQYKAEFPFDVLFPPVTPKNVLAEWLAEKKTPQFHTAETEKYAHVTFFFNGGVEKQFELEDRKLIPSPKVPTYDLQPEMSCLSVADEMAKTIATQKYPFVMLNFAPPDMVGHTGVYEAAVKACEATDEAIGRVKKACDEHGYVMMVTADHGNAEQMISEKGGPHTAHTTYRVPFCITKGLKFRKITHNAALCDVAPTILDVMKIEKPAEMTGQSLL